jgi:hypothetical protein
MTKERRSIFLNRSIVSRLSLEYLQASECDIETMDSYLETPDGWLVKVIGTKHLSDSYFHIQKFKDRLITLLDEAEKELASRGISDEPFSAEEPEGFEQYPYLSFVHQMFDTGAISPSYDARVTAGHIFEDLQSNGASSWQLLSSSFMGFENHSVFRGLHKIFLPSNAWMINEWMTQVRGCFRDSALQIIQTLAFAPMVHDVNPYRTVEGDAANTEAFEASLGLYEELLNLPIFANEFNFMELIP